MVLKVCGSEYRIERILYKYHKANSMTIDSVPVDSVQPKKDTTRQLFQSQ